MILMIEKREEERATYIWLTRFRSVMCHKNWTNSRFMTTNNILFSRSKFFRKHRHLRQGKKTLQNDENWFNAWDCFSADFGRWWEFRIICVDEPRNTHSERRVSKHTLCLSFARQINEYTASTMLASTQKTDMRRKKMRIKWMSLKH